MPVWVFLVKDMAQAGLFFRMSRGSQRGRYFGSRRIPVIGARKPDGKLPAIDPRRSVSEAWAYFEALDYLETNQVQAIPRRHL
jgi:hypothetical protein